MIYSFQLCDVLEEGTENESWNSIDEFTSPDISITSKAVEDLISRFVEFDSRVIVFDDGISVVVKYGNFRMIHAFRFKK